MVGRTYQSIINQYSDNETYYQQLIRDETEYVAQSAKSWKHELENNVIRNMRKPVLMDQTICLLMDCFINGINNNKKRAQCLMKKIKKIMNEKMEDDFEKFSENDDEYVWVNGKEESLGLSFLIKKDSKNLKMINGLKKNGFEVIIGNNFCYKSVMDRMKNIYDKLEMYNDYL